MATGREIFRLYGTVGIEGADESEKQLEKLDKTAEKTDKKVSTFGKTVGKIGKGVAVFGGAVVAGGTALVGMAKKGAESTDRIDKLSQKLGLTRKGFQEWDFVMSQAGVSIDSMQTGMKTLTQRMGESLEGAGAGADLFKQLGVEITDSMSQEEAFNATVTALQGMEDGVEKAALAQELFGRNGQDLLPLLNQTAEATEEAKKQAQDLGLVLGDDVVDAGVASTDLFDQLTRTLQGGFMQVVGQMLPLINQVVKILIEEAPKIMALLIPLFENIMPPFVELVQNLLPVVIDLLGVVVSEILPALAPILPVLIEAIVAIVKGIAPLLPIIADMITKLLPPLINLIVPIIELAINILESVLPPLIDVIGVLAKTITTVLAVAFENIKPIIDGITKAFGGLIDFIVGVFTGDWERAWGGIVDYISGIFQAMVGFVKAPINNIIGLINALFASIGSIDLPDILGGGSISLGQIPMLAKGTDNFQGGMAVVGEQGAELVNLPRGSQVIPHEQSKQMTGNTYNINVNGDTSPTAIVRKLREHDRLKALGVV